MKPGTSSEPQYKPTAKDIIISRTVKYTLHKDLKVLWHLNYYDGPISGIALSLLDGKQYYFDQMSSFDYVECYFEDEEPWPRELFRFYVLYELTAEQVEYHNYWHNEFRNSVGTHTDYNDKGKRTLGATVPGYEKSDFWHRHKQALYPEQDKKYPKGWFIW